MAGFEQYTFTGPVGLERCTMGIVSPPIWRLVVVQTVRLLQLALAPAVVEELPVRP